MNAMTVVHMGRGSEDEHASAVRSLAGARREESRLVDLHAAAGKPGDALSQERLSAAHAVVVARVEWLHWIDEGESAAPWADGEWSPDARTSRPLPWDHATDPDVCEAMARERRGVTRRARPFTRSALRREQPNAANEHNVTAGYVHEMANEMARSAVQEP
jgi:hypothetical protein